MFGVITALVDAMEEPAQMFVMLGSVFDVGEERIEFEMFAVVATSVK